ncbi:ATP-binding protein [Streptomyces sp. NPDC087845]|uniref:ATP-binding protein n=1 Tax=Streptomyces sp. NPDC087845 TaxID=3365806 RepID=UPI0037F4D8CD
MITVTYAFAPAGSPSQGARRPPQASGSAWPLAHSPEAAGEARKITREVLARWKVAEEAADTVLLAVSEFVTNSVEHAQPPLNLELSRDPGTRRVHIEVADGGPAARDGDWAAGCAPGEHGRGLEIIDRLTAAHGDRQEAGRAIHWADVNTARVSPRPPAAPPPGRRLPAALRQQRMPATPSKPSGPARPVTAENRRLGCRSSLEACRMPRRRRY